jgi:hypothetical protein
VDDYARVQPSSLERLNNSKAASIALSRVYNSKCECIQFNLGQTFGDRSSSNHPEATRCHRMCKALSKRSSSSTINSVCASGSGIEIDLLRLRLDDDAVNLVASHYEDPSNRLNARKNRHEKIDVNFAAIERLDHVGADRFGKAQPEPGTPAKRGGGVRSRRYIAIELACPKTAPCLVHGSLCYRKIQLFSR